MQDKSKMAGAIGQGPQAASACGQAVNQTTEASPGFLHMLRRHINLRYRTPCCLRHSATRIRILICNCTKNGYRDNGRNVKTSSCVDVLCLFHLTLRPYTAQHLNAVIVLSKSLQESDPDPLYTCFCLSCGHHFRQRERSCVLPCYRSVMSDKECVVGMCGVERASGTCPVSRRV